MVSFYSVCRQEEYTGLSSVKLNTRHSPCFAVTRESQYSILLVRDASSDSGHSNVKE